MLASAIEGKLVRGYFESLVRQFDGLNLSLVIDQHVVNTITALADKMLVPFDQRIEMLRTPAHQYLKLLIGDQFLQIAVNRSKTNIRQFFAYPIVNLIRGRMRFIVLDGVPDDFKLPGGSCFFPLLRHLQAARSSARDCCASGVRTARAL